MKYTLKLEEFEGPLELLLKLIEDEKLDITTISLARVTDQYLAFVEQEDHLPPDEVADFLVVAAKLIYLKSKYLLPSFDFDEEDADDLEYQLKIFREYYRASKHISKLIGKKKFSYIRTAPFKLKRDASFSPPKKLKVGDFPGAFELVLKRLDAIAKLPKLVLKVTVSIREKIILLRDAMQKGILEFHKTYDKDNRSDAIISFLALLELVKMRHVTVNQENLFSEITIKKGQAHE